MKETKQKIVKTNLKTLLKRYSKTDALKNLETSYNQETIHKIALKDLVDSRYLKKVIVPEYKINEAINLINKKIYTPVLVRPIEGDKYEVLNGRNIFFAALKAGVDTIDCLIKNYGDEESLIISATYVRDLKGNHIVDEAYLLSLLKKQFNYKNKDLCLFFKQSPSQISNILKLSELNSKTLKLISDGSITYGHAKAFSRLNDEQINKITKEILDKKLSVRETERLVKSISSDEDINPNLIVTKQGIILKFSNKENKEKALERIEKMIKKGKIKLWFLITKK